MPKPRQADDDARLAVVAEARALTQQLATYLELIGEWALEEEDDA